MLKYTCYELLSNVTGGRGFGEQFRSQPLFGVLPVFGRLEENRDGARDVRRGRVCHDDCLGCNVVS